MRFHLVLPRTCARDRVRIIRGSRGTLRGYMERTGTSAQRVGRLQRVRVSQMQLHGVLVPIAAGPVEPLHDVVT